MYFFFFFHSKKIDRKQKMSEGIELRVRAPQRGDSERLLSGEEEGDFDEEGGVAGAGVGHQDGLDWERDHEDDDDASGGDLLRDIDSKRRKRNVAEPYYYQSQRKVTPLSPHSKEWTFLFIHKACLFAGVAVLQVVIGVLVGLGTILLVLLSVMVGYRMGAPDSSSNAGNHPMHSAHCVMALPDLDLLTACSSTPPPQRRRR